jgi:hypothetical protein
VDFAFARVGEVAGIAWNVSVVVKNGCIYIFSSIGGLWRRIAAINSANKFKQRVRLINCNK